MTDTNSPPQTEQQKPPKKAHPVLWTAGAAVLAVVVILLLGAVDTPDGDPIVKNPEALITQILITAGVIGAATLPLLIKTQKDAAAAKEQVSNDHPTNLRVEQDHRHDAVVTLVTEKFEELTRHFNRQLDGIRSDTRGIRYDVGRNTNNLEKTREKLDQHLDDSREIVAELKGEIQELHKINASIEDTIPVSELREGEEPQQEEE